MRKANTTPMTAGEFRERVLSQCSFGKMGLDDFVSIEMENGCVLVTVLEDDVDAQYLHNRKVDDICDFFEYGDGKHLAEDSTTRIFAVGKDSHMMHAIIDLDVEEMHVDGSPKFVMTTVVR